MAVIDWIHVLILGGIAGALGQGARVIIGLKKVNDQASADNSATRDLIEASRLMVSLLIGFVAGALAAIAMGMQADQAVQSQQLLGLLAAGYTGADFIEGLMSRAVPSLPAAPAITAQPAATPQPTGS